MLFAAPARPLGAAPSRVSAAVCGPGRKGGYPTPKWWPTVRSLIKANRSYFPAGISIPFLGAWIEKESDGRYNLTSSANEVGYFQLHPSEIEGMVGKTNVQKTMDEIRSSPTASMQWGGRYLSRYDKRLTNIGVPRGGDLYYGLLKNMHWNPPKAIRWAKHVRYALDGWPSSYADFIRVAADIQAGKRSWDPNVKRVDQLPSCSAFQLLARVPTFITPEDSSDREFRPLDLIRLTQPIPFLLPFSWNVIFSSLKEPSMATLLDANSGFFNLQPRGVLWDTPAQSLFAPPVPLPTHVTSGYTAPRPRWNRRHGALDFKVPTGTEVYAIADGVIRRVKDVTGQGTGRGMFIEIDHSLVGYPVMSRYLHLSGFHVRTGDRVRRGQLIARSGATDANAPHVHLDVVIPSQVKQWYEDRFGVPSGGWVIGSTGDLTLPLEGLIPISSGVGAERPLYKSIVPRPDRTPQRFAFAGVSALVLFGAAFAIEYWGQ